jgi:Tfp pilus assembly protein PilF
MADFAQPAEAAQLIEKSRRAAVEAIRLNPGLAGPFATLGAIKTDYEWDWKGADEQFRKALSLNPNHGFTHMRYSRFLTLQGRFDEAMEQARFAHQLDPLSVAAAANLAHVHFYARHNEDAIAQLRRALELDPTFSRARLTIARCLALMGKFDEARKELAAIAPAADVLVEKELAAAYVEALAGNREPARAAVRRIEGERGGHPPSSITLATVYSVAGEVDRAFQVLESAVAAKEINVVYIKVSPTLTRLHADARFGALLRRVGLAEN